MKIKLLVKKIKHKIIKFLYEYFKKIYIRNINISDNEILQYAHNELTIAGHNKNSKYYNDIIEVIAAISKNNNINSSIKHNISVINKLCDKVPITYLTLKEDEFEQSISSKILYINKRHNKILYINKRYNKIYKYLNKMFVTNAYSISPQYILSIKTKKLLPFSIDLSWKNDVFETKDGVLTGRYFNTCYIKECQIKSGYYIPFNTIKLKGVKVEIKEFISIMTIDCENSDLIRLSNLYDIDWKTTNDFKNKHINDITVKDYNNYIKSISIVYNDKIILL